MKQKIQEVKLSCLENRNSWIFLPTRIDFYGSNNRVDYFKLGSVEATEIESNEKRNSVKIGKSFSDANYRYLKVVAENIKYCPDDHPAAGGKAWLFVDEIIKQRTYRMYC